MVDVLTWGLLVPMLAANPDPVKVAHAHEMFYNFFSYNTACPTVTRECLYSCPLMHSTLSSCAAISRYFLDSHLCLSHHVPDYNAIHMPGMIGVIQVCADNF